MICLMKPYYLLSILIFTLIVSVLVSGCTNAPEIGSGPTPAANASGSIAPAMVWQHRYGGPSWDDGAGIVQTDDGFAVVGMSQGPPIQAIEENHTYRGDFRMFLLRTDASGNEIWNSTYGGPGDSLGTAIVRTSDGGFALLGDKARVIRCW